MAATEPAPLAAAFDVDAADEVRVGTTNYEWANPLIVVTASPPVEWDVPQGTNWRTRDLTVQTQRGTQYRLAIDTGGDSVCYRVLEDGGEKSFGHVERVARADETDDQTHTCPDCGETFDDGRGLSMHRNSNRTDCGADADEVFTCDECAKEFESQAALDGHSPVHEDDDTPPVELPDGVTAADVQALTDEHESLGDVAAEIGVTRGRARTITHALGCYGDVRDAPGGAS